MNIPTDYKPGYEKARAIAPDIADNYIAHTHIGDPLGEAMAEDLKECGPEDSRRFITAAMNREGEEALRNAPASLREFFRDAETPPEWLDYSAFAPGVRMFHRNSSVILAAFIAGVLIEGFTTNIAKSFHITGRVRDQGVRRLGQNNRHMIEIFLPGGMYRDGDGWKLSVRIRIIHARIRRLLNDSEDWDTEAWGLPISAAHLGQNNRHMIEIFLPGGMYRDGDGWKLSVRIRIIHARIRRLLNDSEDWDTEAWGLPISAAHLGYAISAFSARLLKHMKSLGATYSDEEYASFMAVWRYSGHLMGIPETILFQDADEALELYDIGHICEPESPIESVVMAHSLVNSAPLIAGVTDPAGRRNLARYVYRISRGLIGKEAADSLMYPALSSFGVVWWFKMQQHYGHILGNLHPGRRQESNFSRFTGLLDTSLFDEEGVRYTLPDHVYAEEGGKW